MTADRRAIRRMFFLTLDNPGQVRRADPVRYADNRTSMCDARIAVAVALDALEDVDRNGYALAASP